MGVEWYILDDQRREYFELGSGPWGAGKSLPMMSKHEILIFIVTGWDHLIRRTTELRNGTISQRAEAQHGISFEYCVWLRDHLWKWLDGRDKANLRVVTDEFSLDERHGVDKTERHDGKTQEPYEETASRYHNSIDEVAYVLEHYGPGQEAVWRIMTS